MAAEGPWELITWPPDMVCAGEICRKMTEVYFAMRVGWMVPTNMLSAARTLPASQSMVGGGALHAQPTLMVAAEAAGTRQW